VKLTKHEHACVVAEKDGTSIVIDPGSFSPGAAEIIAGGDAILITHEHSDHINGLNVLAKKLRIPVYITASTQRAYVRAARDSQGNKICLERVENFEAGRSFQIGDIAVTPFTIPHDAADPVGFTFRSEGVKAAIATDLGYMPASVKDHIRGCQMLIVESNHDGEMLRVGPYPWSVEQRVLSRVGHLSNDALADFIVNDYDGEAEYLILAHLSEQNNHPEVARTAAERALDRHGFNPLGDDRLNAAVQAARRLAGAYHVRHPDPAGSRCRPHCARNDYACR